MLWEIKGELNKWRDISFSWVGKSILLRCSGHQIFQVQPNPNENHRWKAFLFLDIIDMVLKFIENKKNLY